MRCIHITDALFLRSSTLFLILIPELLTFDNQRKKSLRKEIFFQKKILRSKISIKSQNQDDNEEKNEFQSSSTPCNITG